MTTAIGVEVIPAPPEQEPVLANMIELYAHDFSEFVDLKLGADGRFGYERLPLYWKEPGRHPFLIKAGGRLAGFVFVRRGSEISDDADVWDVAEFFILRGFRRLGVGTRAAHEVWRKFLGRCASLTGTEMRRSSGRARSAGSLAKR
jgi:predicted acetyltransferase